MCSCVACLHDIIQEGKEKKKNPPESVIVRLRVVKSLCYYL